VLTTPARSSGEGKSALSRSGRFVSPRQFCSNLLQNCLLGPSLGTGAHVAEISRGKSSHFRKSLAQVCCQAIDDFRAPSFFLLTIDDLASDAPVQQYELSIDSKGRLDSCLPDALLQTGQECRVGLREVGDGCDRRGAFARRAATSPRRRICVNDLCQAEILSIGEKIDAGLTCPPSISRFLHANLGVCAAAGLRGMAFPGNTRASAKNRLGT